MCRKIYFAILVVSVASGFQHGYHFAIVNNPSEVMQEWIKELKIKQERINPSHAGVDLIWAVVVAIFSVGGTVGALMIGIFADNFGRKGSLKWNALLVLVAAAITLYSKRAASYKVLLFGRFLAGVTTGLTGGLCQMYSVEISPDEIRGALSGVYQVAISFSAFVATIAGILLSEKDTWHYMFVIPVFPAIFQLIALSFCPESPKFLLITQGKDAAAEKALKWLREKDDVEEELDLLKEEDNLVKELRGTSLTRILTNPLMTNALICCLILNIAQQMCGIKTIIQYSTLIFEEMKLGRRVSFYITTGMNLPGVISSIIFCFIIDKYGRRKMALISLIGLTVITALIFISLFLARRQIVPDMKYVTILSYFVFNSFYCIGIGPLAWFIPAEMFYHTPRTIAVCLSVAANSISSFIIGQAFYVLKNEIGVYTTLIFIVLDVFSLLYIHQRLPETNKLSAIDVINMYNIQQ
ncbi:solute carrier family 2, facilitated glucose transporter member 1-like [Tribolium madens]|uniref:solute carrier family 2, facilitated glucose transporter member 1-like n=1 Tax=Tribolium madens TaxID=41895 RepID=UPI001CF7621F|nr:solute carrier family 2, facilitated glucose transporter member 1-like [Tribolium madens]